MRQINIQYLEASGMITIEFKISETGKDMIYAVKEIKTVKDYEDFMDELLKGLSPVEDQVIHLLKQKAKKKMMVTV
jgi:hypothetical protein